MQHEGEKIKFIQREMYTTRKIQHKVVVLGAGLEVLRRPLCYGAKIHYQNRKDVIPYQAYIYIDIYIVIRTNQYIVMYASRGIV